MSWWRLAERSRWRLTASVVDEDLQQWTMYRGALPRRHRWTVTPSLNWMRWGTSSQWSSEWNRCVKPLTGTCAGLARDKMEWIPHCYDMPNSLLKWPTLCYSFLLMMPIGTCWCLKDVFRHVFHILVSQLLNGCSIKNAESIQSLHSKAKSTVQQHQDPNNSYFSKDELDSNYHQWLTQVIFHYNLPLTWAVKKHETSAQQ